MPQPPRQKHSTGEEGKGKYGPEFKVSAAEKARMRTMCVLDDKASDAASPKWFRDLFAKNQYEKYRAQVISHTIEQTLLYEDDEVPLYPALVKIILTRMWSSNDPGKRPAYINAAAGLSPYAMLDLYDDYVARMKQGHKEIFNAYSVPSSEFKASRSKLLAQTHDEAEAFMLILKRFTNLIFSLFGFSTPFYRQIKSITDAFREYSLNARTNMNMDYKSSILCIILLQSRRFSQGNMSGQTPCIGDFLHIVNLVKAKICETISQVEVPTDLFRPFRKMQSKKSW